MLTGTIHDALLPDGTLHEFVAHGPNSTQDRGAVVAGFRDLYQATTWGPALAERWLRRYGSPHETTPWLN